MPRCLRPECGRGLIPGMVGVQMIDRLGERDKLEPPGDSTIATFYIGQVTPSMSEDDIKSPFLQYGTVRPPPPPPRRPHPLCV